VDFDRDMILPVRGPAFGCAGDSYINRMESDGNRLRVLLGRDERAREPIFCLDPSGSSLEAAVVPASGGM